MDAAERTYLLVDGENIDWGLGNLLGHKPAPGDRPRWQELLRFAEEEWEQPVRGLFFINAGPQATVEPLDDGVMGFVKALFAMDYAPILLSGDPDEKVVDIGIERTLSAILDDGGDVLLASHDGDFAPRIGELRARGRRVGVLGFEELVSGQLLEAADHNVYDLEAHVGAFTITLPRIRVVALDQFDPRHYL